MTRFTAPTPPSAAEIDPRPRESDLRSSTAENKLSFPERPRKELRKELTAIFQDTISRGQGIVSREESTMQDAREARESSGWFGAINRTLTLSDPYRVEVSLASQKASTAKLGLELVEKAESEENFERKILLLNRARRLFGQREFDLKTLQLSQEAPRTTGLNRVSSDVSHFEVEQEALTVSRDVAITGIVTAGTLGAGAATSLAGRGAPTAVQAATLSFRDVALLGAKWGATIGAIESGARAMDDVERGARTRGEAFWDIAKHTTVSTAFGAAFGLLFNGIGRGWSKFRSTGKEKPGSPEPADFGLRVDGDEIKRILNAPSIEAERNAAMRFGTPSRASTPEPLALSTASGNAGRAVGVGKESPRMNVGKSGGTSGSSRTDNLSSSGSEGPSNVRPGGAGGASGGTSRQSQLDGQFQEVIRKEINALRHAREQYQMLKGREKLIREELDAGVARSELTTLSDLAEETDGLSRIAQQQLEAARAERIEFLTLHPEFKPKLREAIKKVEAGLQAGKTVPPDATKLRSHILSSRDALDAEIESLMQLKRAETLTAEGQKRLSGLYDSRAQLASDLEALNRLRSTPKDLETLKEFHKRYSAE